MRIKDLVQRHGGPSRADRTIGHRCERRPLAIDVDEELDRGLAAGARDANDPGRFEPAEKTDLRTCVIRDAHAAVVFLRLFAKASQDVHLRSSIAEAVGARPSRHARNEYWSARSSTWLSSGLPMP